MLSYIAPIVPRSADRSRSPAETLPWLRKS